MNQYKKRVLLEVNNLKTEFRTENGILKAVEDVSFKLNKGETIGIVGESGSGKSVTALSIMRLISTPPGMIRGGEIIYHAKEKDPLKYKEPVDLLNLPEEEMRSFRGNEISMIFQEPMTSLNPVFTCGNQVTETIMLHQNVSKTHALSMVRELFIKVKLPDPDRIIKAYPHQLSGGQKQRVMIAMAMSCNPGILIADEPTTALDVTVQATIIKLMRELSDEIDMSVIFITHDLGVIADIADKVIVMYKGKIVEQGNVLDVFSNPQHSYTKGLLSCRPPLDIQLKKLPVIEDFMFVTDDGRLVERGTSIVKLVEDYTVSELTQKQRLDDLIKQEPLLKINKLKTYFPLKKNLLGKTKSYIKAVDDVSFEVFPGETLGLVGESGCGKTTLGKTIIRLESPYDGEVIFQNNDVMSLRGSNLTEMRKNMQIIFQDPYSSLNPRLTIGNAIMEPLQVHGLYNSDAERKDKVFELLEKVQLLSDHFNRYPHEFSGGQRQRICIARALSLNPKFLICDESVSALDVSVQAQILNLLIQLREEYNFTYIFISHDLSVVKFISDRIVVMNSGKIEEMGPANDIYNDPQKNYTKKLIDAVPKGRVEDIRKRIAQKRMVT